MMRDRLGEEEAQQTPYTLLSERITPEALTNGLEDALSMVNSVCAPVESQSNATKFLNLLQQSVLLCQSWNLHGISYLHHLVYTHI